MHKSRLAGFIIDCRTDDLDQAGLFWSQALGYSLKKSSAGEDAQYKLLDTPSGDLHIEVQKVDHPSRVHLDIEADDIEAEVKRLEKLGAKAAAEQEQCRLESSIWIWLQPPIASIGRWDRSFKNRGSNT